MNWKAWLKGLMAGAISAGANTVTLLVVDPAKFNATVSGLEHLGVAVAVSSIVAAAFYLKQSPLPGITEGQK